MSDWVILHPPSQPLVPLPAKSNLRELVEAERKAKQVARPYSFFAGDPPPFPADPFVRIVW